MTRTWQHIMNCDKWRDLHHKSQQISRFFFGCDHASVGKWKHPATHRRTPKFQTSYIVIYSNIRSCHFLFFCLYHIADGWRRFAFLTRWNSVHLQVLLSATPQGGMFPEVLQPQALLGSLMSVSWKFQFTKIVSEFVINF